MEIKKIYSEMIWNIVDNVFSVLAIPFMHKRLL